MRIALITDGLHPYVMGGMQRHSTMLAQHLPAHGVELVVFHTAHSESAIAAARALDGFPEIVKSRIQHVLVDYPERGRLPGHYIRESGSYSERLLERYHALGIECDFIYAQGLTGRAFIEAKKRGVCLPPIGVNCHGYEMFQRAANMRNKLEHLLLRRTFAQLTQQADYVFSFAGKIREIVEVQLGVSHVRVIQVPNAIDEAWLRSSPSSSSGKRRFIFLGRYERRKGIEELHAVLNDWTGPEIEFVFIGPIPKEKQLDLPWVQYRGSVSDPAALKAELDRGDVLVCPSYSEGMPTVILEAMARGLAIVATDVGAVASLVDTTNGILVERLSLNALKSSILRVSSMLDEELSTKKSVSLKRVSNYTWGRVSLDVVENIRSAVSS
ncbi:MAG TPA: glycosyl transferase family 1 [Verrucomicrobiales bacterium]|nr:glycosyl transferase family 1 [Verrucomicrobiales bacterium]|tara:strand:+ start:1461 stop:2612 length:1152 start_codon:yes stop_codon:yes gene_type:complete